MKISVAAVLLQVLNFLVHTGEALGQHEEGRGGEELGPLVDAAATSQLQHTTRYSGGLQESDNNRSKNAGGTTGGRRHHNSHGSSRRQQHHDCNNNDIAECVELLEVLTNKDLGFAATVDELNKMCPVLLNGLQCIDNYTRRCLTQKHRDYFNKLYAGTIRVIKDLCNTRGRYQEEYIRHAPCMRQVNPKYNVCSVTYHQKTVSLNHMQDASVSLSEDEKNRNVIILCCSFQEYLQCSERVVFETCGNDTALFTKEFLDRMAGPIVQGECYLVFNLSLCPRELFPNALESLASPDDPSAAPSPSSPSPAEASHHEAATGREDSKFFIHSSPAPLPQAPGTMAPTPSTTQRPAPPPPDALDKGLGAEAATNILRVPSAVKVMTPAAGRDAATPTVGSRVVLGPLRSALKVASLHEAPCGATETLQESPREHGSPAAPLPPLACHMPLLAAAHFLLLVNPTPGGAAQHDGAATNSLSRLPSPPSQGLGTNLETDLYPSGVKLSSDFSFARPRRPIRRPWRKPSAGAPRHVPPAGTRIKGATHSGMANPRRRAPPKGRLPTAGLRASNTTRHRWGLRHPRRHSRPPHARRRNFQRRRPLKPRTFAEARQESNETFVDPEEHRPKPTIELGAILGLDGATSAPQPDEEQETFRETDTDEGTRTAVTIANSSIPSSTSLEQPRPLATFPKSAGQAEVPPSIPQPDDGMDIRRPGNLAGRHPRRRHRRPLGRRKFYRNRKHPIMGKESIRGRTGRRRFRRPLGATGTRRPTTLAPHSSPGLPAPQVVEEETRNELAIGIQPFERDQETALEDLVDDDDATLTTPPSPLREIYPSEGHQETTLEGLVDGDDATLTTPPSLLGVRENYPSEGHQETTLEGLVDGDDAMLTTPLSLLGVRENYPSEGHQETTLEGLVDGDDVTLTVLPSPPSTTTERTETVAPSKYPVLVAEPPETQGTRNPVAKIRPELLPIDPALLTNHTDDPPQNATEDGPRGTLKPGHDMQETTDATTERGSSTAQGLPLRGTHNTTMDDPAWNINDSDNEETHPSDADAEADEQHILEADTGSGEIQSREVLDLWLQNLFLSELREAVIPAPTPVPYTVRLWQERDKVEHAKGFFSSFVPLALDVVESDFVPLTHPENSTSEEDLKSHFETENPDVSDFEFSVKGSEVDFEATIVEKVTPQSPPRSQHEQSSTTASPAAPETIPHTSAVNLASHNASQPTSGAAANRRDEGTILWVSPTTETQRTGDAATSKEEEEESDTDDEEEKKGKKKKEKRNKKKKTKKKEKGPTVPGHKSVQRTEKATTPVPLPQPTTGDISKTKVPPADVVEADNISSPEASSGAQATNLAPSASLPPSSFDAGTYSHPTTRQGTEDQVTYTLTHTDTTQGSFHNHTSSDKSNEHYRSSDSRSGAPDRPEATDSHDTLAEGGEAGVATLVEGSLFLFTLAVGVGVQAVL